jgi:hypothetical protein
VDADVPNIKLDYRASTRSCVGCVALLVIIAGAISAFIYFQFHPRDRIQIGVKNIPIGTRFLCLAVEKDGKIELMDWSPYYVFPGRMAAADCAMSYRTPDDNAPIVNWYVMWEFGSRYGIVTRRTDKVWRVTWFEANEVPIQGRGFLLGEGEVAIDITKGRTEEMNTDDVRRFGFQDYRWNDEK